MEFEDDSEEHSKQFAASSVNGRVTIRSSVQGSKRRQCVAGCEEDRKEQSKQHSVCDVKGSVLECWNAREVEIHEVVSAIVRK